MQEDVSEAATTAPAVCLAFVADATCLCSMLLSGRQLTGSYRTCSNQECACWHNA
jgi:hypothetical protein